MRFVDSSHHLKAGQERFKLEIETFFVDEYLQGYNRRPGDWYIMQEIRLSSHLGVHVESPYHHLKEGEDASQVPLEELVGPCIVLDFSHKSGGSAIMTDEVREAAKDMRPEDIVIIKTGLGKLFDTQEYFYRRPFIEEAAVEWLIERGMSAMGMDAAGLEKSGREDQPIHRLLARNGIPVIEDLANLHSLDEDRVFLIAAPLPIAGLDASPVRAIAIEGFPWPD